MSVYESFRNAFLKPLNQDLLKIWIFMGIVILVFLWCRMWFRTLDGTLMDRKAREMEGSVYVCDWITKEDFEKALTVCKVKSIERTTKEGKAYKI